MALALALPLGAQWINYPTAGVPKTPHGVINLGAPAPRTGDGRPDLSGMWEAENTYKCNPTLTACNDFKIGAQFLDFAAPLKDGLPYQPWAAEAAKTRAAGNRRDDPASRCMPPGVPRNDALPTYKKIVQTPGLLIILDEFNATFRQVFTDGRPLPEDPNPTFDGYSIGHWDGDTMVVETIGVTNNQWLDTHGNPITEAAKVTERFHRINFGNLDVDVTVNDPKAYTAPWTVTVHQFIVLNTEMIDYFCLENERDVRHIK